MNKIHRVAFVSDIHAPYEDKQAVKLTEKIIGDVGVNEIFFGGDIVDCYSVSDFDRDPKRVVEFQTEFDAAYDVMSRLRKLVDKAAFMPGNHEARWERTVHRHPFLASIRNLELGELMRLSELKTAFVPHGDDYKIGELYYLHGDEAAGGSIFPARNMYLKELGNLIFGHYHKMQVYYNRLKDGTCHGSWANGCLCLLKQAYIKGTAQWQQGFSIVEYHQGGEFRVDQIVFYRAGGKLKGAFGGKLYEV